MKKSYFKRVIFYFLKNKKELTIIVLLGIISLIINIFYPFITAREYTFITQVDVKNIIKYTILLFVLDITSNIIFNITSLISNKFTKKVEIDIQKDITKEIFKLEIANFDKLGTDFFIERAINDSRSLVSNITSLRYIINTIITSLGIYIYIINASYKIFLLILFFSIIIFYINKLKRDLYERKYQKRREAREYQTSSFTELIRGIKDIKVLNIRKTMSERIIKGQEKINEITYQEQKENNSYSIIASIIRNLASLITILYSIYLLYTKEIDGALLLIIYMYHYRVLFLTSDITSLYEHIKDINLNMKNIQDILDNPKYPKEKFGNIEKNHFEGNIEFKNVSFKYDENLVLKNINLKIKPNSTIGFVGRSGSGKTTIFNLIAKLYQVKEGEILIDGCNINDYTELTIRNNISVITQNPYVFNMSIKDNIKIVKPEITDEEIIEKCKLAELHDYIETLPNKYDTLIGENGVILSGGLKQRLSIARALVKKSEIILLDEATSALDNEIQSHIMEAIKNISNEYTILIIAHRLSTVKDCNQIVVIDDGMVKGYDTHDNLIKNNQIYQKLYQKELIISKE